MTKDYRKRFQASLALLTEIYAADVAASATSIAAAAAVAPAVQRGGGRGAEGGGGRGGGGGGAAASAAERGGGRGGGRGNGGGKGGGAGAAERPEGKPRGFKLYDETLLKLLTTLSRSLEASWRQKLFTQTLLECPRVPPSALELVCSLCDMAAQPHDVQTGVCIVCIVCSVCCVYVCCVFSSCVVAWGWLWLGSSVFTCASFDIAVDRPH